MSALDSIGLITEREVRAHFARVSHSTLWRWCRGGIFPKPVRIGPRRTFWRLEDVQAWSAALPIAPTYNREVVAKERRKGLAHLAE